ncbi:hypothetical protein RQP53_21670 [Paucibacter sp. APW11]|uniref:Solute-binding protein family 3/N-terminal domain-containing protein n=1 Tax=Roseateles aquae TaxID=3077235 RepID=A0ABU3PH70_9BURK|nr:hypothetical protein [Paucibacter sp. APW11]MDT9001901.1 hypothetical protein [Paucibacter sp. APW11]
MRLFRRLFLLPLLAHGALLAQETPRPWRVCGGDVALPPYQYNDPKHLGIGELMLVEAGQQVGLAVQFLRFPIKRCRAMLEADEVDTLMAVPTPGNLAQYRFPMKAGALDGSQKVARINLVWVLRSDSPLHWDGQALSGADAAGLLIGTRVSMRAAIEPLQAMGLRVDDSALNTRQLLLKLAGRRIDAAVALQDEVETLLSDAALQGLLIQPKPLLAADFYAVIRQQASAEQQARAAAWWAAIRVLREQPAYRLR